MGSLRCKQDTKKKAELEASIVSTLASERLQGRFVGNGSGNISLFHSSATTCFELAFTLRVCRRSLWLGVQASGVLCTF